MIKVVKALNFPRVICHWLIGEEHHIAHRLGVGGAVMVAGVVVAGFAEGTPRFAHVLIEVVGYGIHALGAMPYIEWLIE